MATLLGTTFSSDEEVATQCDVASIGKTQKTLVVKVNQTAYEAMLNSKTTPRTAVTSAKSKVRSVWVSKSAQSGSFATKDAVPAVAQSDSQTAAQTAVSTVA